MKVTTASSVTWFAVVAVAIAAHVPLRLFNVLLIVSALPLVWLLSAFCSWSAHQHADRYARDVAKVHAGRPAPLPHQEVSR